MISLLLPSRGRPANVARLHASVAATAEGEWEMVVRLDNDDPRIGDYPDLNGVRYLVAARGVLSVMWNECYALASGSVLMQCGDDIVMRTPGWDTIVTAAFPADGIAFVHGDDCSGSSVIGTHGFVRREWVETVGHFVPPYFASDYSDLWLTEVADALGRRIIVPIVTEHMHPSFGKAEWDKTHRERIARHVADDCDRIWRETASERVEDVEKLRAVMA